MKPTGSTFGPKLLERTQLGTVGNHQEYISTVSTGQLLDALKRNHVVLTSEYVINSTYVHMHVLMYL